MQLDHVHLVDPELGLGEHVRAVGVGTALMTQALINVGMVCGLLPVTGLPLPLVSYGGSSTIAVCLAVGLLLATPLTVILVVMGKYVPRLAFLDILLGDMCIIWGFCNGLTG